MLKNLKEKETVTPDLVTAYFTAVKGRDYKTMQRLTQKSLIEKFPDYSYQRKTADRLQSLTKWDDDMNILIVGSIEDKPISMDVWVKVDFEKESLYMRMRWIKERGFMDPHPEGEWGVNTMSFRFATPENYQEIMDYELSK